MKKVKVTYYIIEAGDLFYNPEYHGFHQIKKINFDTIVLSGCTQFLNDATTNIVRHVVSSTYINELIPLVKKYKKYSFMQYGTKIMPNSWVINEKYESKSYLFYENQNILETFYTK
jgi:hypothetical protein